MTAHALLDALLQKLLATDDPIEKAAIVAESAFEQLPATVARVAQHCAALRWFDATIVTALLDAPPTLERLPSVQTVMEMLTTLPFVEHVAWGFAYHDQTRVGLLARTPPRVLQHAAALALPAYNAHANASLARIEALYCAVVAGQSDVAKQTFDDLLEAAGLREDWHALLTIFHTVEEASAVPFAVSIPRTALHHFIHGLAYHELGDLAGAIADYTQAIALNPTDATAYHNRGLARSSQSDLAGAIADYAQAIALNPTDATDYYNRGLARNGQGDLAGAIADYAQAIALNPAHESGLQKLLRILKYKIEKKQRLDLISPERLAGTIARVTDRGFGFLTPSDGSMDIFFHANELNGISFDELHEGDAVTFQIAQGPKGRAATNIARA